MMKLTNKQVMQIERETVALSSSEQWFQLRKGRITSSNAHKVFVRKKNCESLIGTFTCEQWFQLRKGRITSSNAHKVFVRKKNCESLIGTFTGENVKKSSQNLLKMHLSMGKHLNQLLENCMLMSCHTNLIDTYSSERLEL